MFHRAGERIFDAVYELDNTPETPNQSHDDITRVMNLACVGPPPIRQKRSAALRCNKARLFKDLPRQPANTLDLDTRKLKAEMIFLRLRCIPNVVRTKERKDEEDAKPASH